jgi:hypothetical protein
VNDFSYFAIFASFRVACKKKKTMPSCLMCKVTFNLKYTVTVTPACSVGQLKNSFFGLSKKGRKTSQHKSEGHPVLSQLFD